MKILPRLLPLLSSVVVLAASARADELCYGSSLPMQTTNWLGSVTVPKFNPAQGTLTGVRVRLSGTIQGDPGAENPSAVPALATIVFCSDITAQRPDMSVMTTTIPVAQYFDSLDAFDGTIDFAGLSGITHPGTVATATSAPVLTSAADLMLFTGPMGGFATITLPIEARNTAFVNGAGPLVTILGQQASASVEVCYVYTPFVSTFCFGDGSSTGCPCGNVSGTNTSSGCSNSTLLGGRLTSSGAPSMSNDTLALVGTNLPAGSVALLFQGTLRDNGGAGSVFGDGLRCVSGTVIRLAVKNAGPGVVTYPQAGDASISAKGLVPANAVRHYQVWYRDSAAFCTPTTFNLTQGLTVSWQP